MGNTSVQDMHPGYAIFNSFNTVVQLGQHAAADKTIANKLAGFLNAQLGDQSIFVLRILINPFNICKKGQLFRIYRPGNGTGRIIGVNIIRVIILVHANRAHNRQEILFQKVI